MTQISKNILPINEVRTTVIKLGTRLLTKENGQIDFAYMENLTKVLAELKKRKMDIILVSSGAIGAGIGRMKRARRPVTIPEKQAIAAVGQGLLIQYYEKYFSSYNLVVAQILLTRGDLTDRQRYINACNTIHTLLRWGVIPIINENDSVSVEEIQFGDNDHLSALVAGLVDADLLILLSDVDGLYDVNPASSPKAKLIPLVKEITPEIKSCAGKTSSETATGGMVTKVQAAEIAINSGINMIIANGSEPGNLVRIFNGESMGTLFLSKDHYLRQRKRWIAYGRVIKGEIIVDEGAKEALVSSKKSLLAVGITEVKGCFNKGDLVLIIDSTGNEIGRGLVNYSAEEIKKICQLPSSQIAEVLGYDFHEEVIHRDNMVIK